MFNSSGCLSQNALEHYLKHLLHDEDLKAVEDHLASCPFCKDALEGISQLNLSNDDPAVTKASMMSSSSPGLMERKTSYSPGLGTYTNRVNMRLRSRFGYDPSRRSSSRGGPSLRNLFIPAAASIIILVGIIAYFHYFFPERQQLAMAEQEEVPTTAQKKELDEESITEPSATVVGGVFKDDPSPVIEETEIAVDAGEDPVPDEDIVDIVVIDDGAEVEIDVLVSIPEEEVTIAQPEALDEAVTIYAAEEMAGAGISDDPALSAKSRAKEGQQKSTNGMSLVAADQEPKYPGGADSLYSFLERNLLFPISTDKSEEPNMAAQFTITKKGRIKDIQLILSGGEENDNELIRVLQLMPDWIPGIQDGKTVSVQYTLGIHIDKE